MTSPTPDAAPAALDEVPEHPCDTGDFDRTICPEPCGYMHSYCATCGVRQDPCANETPTSAAVSGDRPEPDTLLS